MLWCEIIGKHLARCHLKYIAYSYVLQEVIQINFNPSLNLNILLLKKSLCNLCDSSTITLYNYEIHIDGLVQDRSNSIANALELLQVCTKPSIYVWLSHYCEVIAFPDRKSSWIQL